MRINNILAIILAIATFFVSASVWATPQIQHWQTAAGARVYFVENHNLPMLDVSVGFAAGSAYDSAEKSGVC